MNPYPYVYRWNRMGRKGQRCRIMARGGMNSVCIEFEDGFRAVSSGNAVRKAKLDDYDAAKDGHGSYFAAVEAKRQRGDTHWPEDRRCETNLVGAAGECLACDADQGEHCRGTK